GRASRRITILIGEGYSIRRSVRAASEEDRGDRSREDIKVQPRRPVADVVGIERYALFVGKLVSPGHLPQPGQTRQNLLVERIRLSIPANFISDDWPRTHEAHLSNQHVPELWEFVQTCAAKEPSDASNSGVVPQFVLTLPFLIECWVESQVVLE